MAKESYPKGKYSVGRTVVDGNGNEWTIARKWEHGDYFDLELIADGGARGSLRVKK